MNRLSKKAEERLLSAVRDVCRELDSHPQTPTQAVIKVARDARLEPGLVPLLVQAYNTGQVTLQREQHNSALEKFAEVPLADAYEVLKELYPKHVETPQELRTKTAVSDEYSVPPRPSLLEQRAAFKRRRESLSGKFAAAPQLPPKPLVETRSRQFGTFLAQEKRAAEELRRQQGKARDTLTNNLVALAGYFKVAHHGCLSLGEVEADCTAAWGPEVTSLFDGLTRGLYRQQKRAAALPLSLRVVDLTETPHSWVKLALDARRRWLKLSTERKEHQEARLAKTAAEVEGLWVSAPEESVLGPATPGESEQAKKAAGLLSTLGLGTLATTGLRGMAPAPTGDLVDSVLSKLESPQHEEKLRSIQAKADLTDFMANDPVISGYANDDPDQVLDAYNEISQLSPRAATQPALMRALLRKKLTRGEGGVEPTEIGQIVDLERGLRQNVEQRVPPKTGSVLETTSVLRI